MALVVPDASEVILLSYLVNKISPGNVKLRLFTNNITPGESTALGDLTECSATGYAAISLTGSSWTVATETGVTSATFAEQTFTMTAATTVYGYYITDSAGAVLLWIEKFSPSSFALGGGGGVISVSPAITLD